MIKLEGSLIIGYCFDSSDSGTLIVGKQHNGKIDVINAFAGKEAKELFDKLITVKNNKKEN